MKSILKKGLSLLLVLTMVVGICPAAFAVNTNGSGTDLGILDVLGTETKENTLKVVSLGDSMVNGYGLDGYEVNGRQSNGYLAVAEEAYPYLFSEWLEQQTGATVELTPLAISCTRSSDLDFVLHIDYTDQNQVDTANMATWDADRWYSMFEYGDYFTWDEHTTNRYNDWISKNVSGDAAINSRVAGTANVARIFQTEVADADWVLANIGGCDYGVYLLQAIVEGKDTSAYDVQHVLDRVDDEETRNLIDKCNTAAKEYLLSVEGLPTEIIDKYYDFLTYVNANFIVSLKSDIDRIVELNPDVYLVLVGLINAQKELRIKVVDGEDSYVIPFGEMLSRFFELLNAYMAALPAGMQAAGEYPDATIYYADALNVDAYYAEFASVGSFSELPDIVRSRVIDDAAENLLSAKGKLNLDLIKKYEDVMAEVEEGDVSALQAFLAFYGQATVEACAGYLGMEKVMSEACQNNEFTSETMLNLLVVANSIEGSMAPVTARIKEKVGADAETLLRSAPIWATNAVKAGAIPPLAAGFGKSEDEIAANFDTYFELYLKDQIMTIAKTGTALEGMSNTEIQLYAAADLPAAADPHYSDIAGCKQFMETYNSMVGAYLVTVDEAFKYARLDPTDANADVKDKITTANSVIDAGTWAALLGAASAVTTPESTLAAFKEFEDLFPLMNIYSRCIIARGIGSHPSAKGHKQIFNSIVNAVSNGITVDVQTQAVLKETAATIIELAKQYGPVVAEQAWQYAEEQGYIDMLRAEKAKLDAQLEIAKAQTEATIEQAKAQIEIAEQQLADAQAALIAKQAQLKGDILGQLDELEKQLEETKAYLEQLKAEEEAIAEQAAKDAQAAAEKAVRDARDALAKAEQAVLEAADEAAREVAEQAAQAAREALAAAEEALLTAAADAAQATKDAIDKQVAAAEALIEATQTKIDELEELIPVVEAQVEALKAKIDEIETKIENIINGTEDAYEAFRQMVADAEALAKAIDAAAANDYAALKEGAEAAKAAIGDAAAAIVRSYNMLTERLDFVEDVAAGVYAEAVALHEDLKAGVFGGVMTAVMGINPLLEAAADLSDAINAIAAALPTVGEEIYATAAEAMAAGDPEAAGQIISAALLKQVQAVAPYVAGYVEGMTETAENLKTGFIASAEQLQTIIAEQLDKLDGVLNTRIGNMAAIIAQPFIDATTSPYILSDDSYYVSLGDDSAQSESFADVLRTELTLKDSQYNNLAKNGMRPDDILAALDDEFTPDDYTVRNFNLDKEELVAEIEKADLITISFAPNTFAVKQVGAMLNPYADTYEMNWGRFVGDEKAVYVAGLLNTLKYTLTEKGIDEETAATLVGFVEAYTYSVASFITHYPQMVTKIHEINPLAEVILVGAYNSFDDVNYAYGDYVIPLGTVADVITKTANAQTLVYSLISTNTAFVKVPDTETTLDANFANYCDENGNVSYLGFVNMLDTNASIIPTADGHVYIKERIMGALMLECRHITGDPVKENEVPATCTEVGGYDTVVYCTYCGAELSREHTELEKIAHNYVAEITKLPTFTEEGIITYTCTCCKDTYTEPMPKLTAIPLEQRALVELDRYYLIMKVGDTADIKAIFSPEDFEYTAILYNEWTVTNDKGFNNDVISVEGKDDGSCTVTALGKGTAYAVITVREPENGQIYVERCRIDVTEEEPASQITRASLPIKSAKVELYKTDYTPVTVLLEMYYLLAPARVDEAKDNGHTLLSAKFSNPAVAQLFNLRVLDDRTVEIIPTEYAINNPKAVKSTVKSTIDVVVGNETTSKTFTTAEKLTMSVKKTLPAVTAKLVSIDLTKPGEYPITFTKATVTKLELNPAKTSTDWLKLNAEGMSVSATEAAPQKNGKSGRIYALATLEGWAVPKAVTINAKTVLKAAKAPTIAVKATGNVDNSIAMKPITYTVTVKNFEGAINYSLVKVIGTNKDGFVDATEFFDAAIDGNKIVLTLKAGKTLDTAYKYKATVAATGEGLNLTKDVALGVKNTVNAKVTLSLSKKGAIDVIRYPSTVTITPKLKNFYNYKAEDFIVTFTKTYDAASKAKVSTDASEFFSYSIVDGNIVVSGNGNIKNPKDKFSVTVTLKDGAAVVATATTPLTVKMGAVKLTKVPSKLNLLYKDEYSYGELTLTSKDATLNRVKSVQIIENRTAVPFEIEVLESGEIVLGYRNNDIAPRLYAGTAKTIKLAVFFEGNMTTKPNATISLKIIVR